MRKSLLAITGVCVMMGAACGKKKSAKDEGSGGGSGTTGGTAGAAITSSLNVSTTANGKLVGDFGLAGTNVFGHSTAAGLKSLKYFVTNIEICEGMTVSGSGFSGTQGCLGLYAGTRDDAKYGYTLDGAGGGPSQADYDRMLAAARASDDGFVDLMSETDRAKLGGTTALKKEDAHAYNYGNINWYLPYKLKAEIPVTDTTGVAAGTFRTKDGTTSTATDFPITTVDGSFLDNATASEAVLLFPNGGNWFRFQKPLVVTEDDIAAQTKFKLALVMNPEGMLQAWSAPVMADGFSGCSGCNLLDATGAGIRSPMLGLIPIPFRDGQTVQKEIYDAKITGTANGHTNNAVVRLELYFVKEDAERTVYGAQLTALTSAADGVTTDSFYPLPNVAFMETAADGSLDFQPWSKIAMLKGFMRKAAVGDKTTGTLRCGDLGQGGWKFTGCGDKDELALSFTLNAIEDVAR